MKILVVEDDKKIAQFLLKGLKEEGYVTHWVQDGDSALQNATQEEWDVLVLDRMLPKRDGLTLCREIRQKGNRVPILILSARSTIENRVEGLDAGADDYLPKPFSFNELLARIRALARRKTENLTSTLTVGDFQLDMTAHTATFQGNKIDLTNREFALLQLFMKRKGHILSRTLIAESVWDYDFQSGTNVIDVYVNYLRNKLKKISGRDVIETVRNRGYLFKDPAE
ncbi:MAG: Transcriptional activator protein CopR [Elusimicrobia bacterium]|nr:Transcriptional activator protein CopR [Elusimicrobiota bacterium]